MEPTRKVWKGDKTAQLREGRRDSMEDAIEDCPACKTVFDETCRRPHTLPCGHTSCTRCVNDNTTQLLQVTCPSCRAEYPMAVTGPFPVNNTIENLLRRLRDRTQAVEVLSTATATFQEAQKTAPATFQEAQKTANATFQEAQKTANATFQEAQKTATATFQEAQKTANATFQEAQKTATAPFQEAQKTANATFKKAQKTANATFKKAQETVTALISPSFKVEDLRCLTQHARDLLQRGLVFAVHTTAGRSRQASLSLEDDRLYLHCLRDQPMPRGVVTLQLDEVAAAAPPCRVFLELGWNGTPSRRVLIHLDTDNPRARQFLLLCTGQRGPSYNGSTLLQVVDEGQPRERVVGGDYERKNGEGGAALLPDLDKDEHRESRMAGVVGGRCGGVPARGAQFCITTKDLPGRTVPYVIGQVEGGLDVVREAIWHHPITEVTVVDCGVVVD